MIILYNLPILTNKLFAKGSDPEEFTMKTSIKTLFAAALITASASASAWGPFNNNNGPWNNNSNNDFFSDAMSDMVGDFFGDVDFNMNFKMRARGQGRGYGNANSRYYGYGNSQYAPYYGYAPYGYAPLAQPVATQAIEAK